MHLRLGVPTVVNAEFVTCASGGGNDIMRGWVEAGADAAADNSSQSEPSSGTPTVAHTSGEGPADPVVANREKEQSRTAGEPRCGSEQSEEELLWMEWREGGSGR